ncbi:hypothetical protein XP420_16000 [Xanthomonas perforans]|uniref:hypothetical protein n=1 Tax=Xanthomonas perforans TaxID=442694 RepID=UPI00062D08C0|nr:hypothetical protein [Xanthomonas perforans]KLC04103.1 hypothetical protein XP420_16000 [Xanthomonas perforans]
MFPVQMQVDQLASAGIEHRHLPLAAPSAVAVATANAIAPGAAAAGRVGDVDVLQVDTVSRRAGQRLH